MSANHTTVPRSTTDGRSTIDDPSGVVALPADSSPAVAPPAVASSAVASPAAAARRPFRLRRSATDRMLGGVCGGLAESLDVDPALVRIGAVVLTLIGAGALVPVYAAVWLVAPIDEPTRSTPSIA